MALNVISLVLPGTKARKVLLNFLFMVPVTLDKLSGTLGSLGDNPVTNACHLWHVLCIIIHWYFKRLLIFTRPTVKS